jgi:RimJ/RimL family protein N-acetyltransferase
MKVNETLQPSAEVAEITLPPEVLTVYDGVTLQLMHATDADRLYNLVNENRGFLSKTMEYMADYTHEGAEKETENTQIATEHGEEASYLINREGKIIGTVSLYARKDDTARMGYYLAEEATGQGVATSSAKRLLDFGFNEWGLNKVVLSIKPDNFSSQRVATKLGAERTGETITVDHHRGNLRSFELWAVSTNEHKRR